MLTAQLLLVLCVQIFQAIPGQRLSQSPIILPTQASQPCAVYSLIPDNQTIHDYYNFEVYSIIESRGFAVETHKVITEDGYILTLFRAVNTNLTATEKSNLKPVLLYHGFSASSSAFVMSDSNGFVHESSNLVENHLLFALANRNYDVWLANWRGNGYSNEHVKYSYNCKF